MALGVGRVLFDDVVRLACSCSQNRLRLSMIATLQCRLEFRLRCVDEVLQHGLQATKLSDGVRHRVGGGPVEILVRFPQLSVAIMCCQGRIAGLALQCRLQPLTKVGMLI
ncbi:hypothetical protein [Mycobacterium avium]